MFTYKIYYSKPLYQSSKLVHQQFSQYGCHIHGYVRSKIISQINIFILGVNASRLQCLDTALLQLFKGNKTDFSSTFVLTITK